MRLRNSKVQDKEFERFFKKIFEVSVKIFCRKWEGETLSK